MDRDALDERLLPLLRARFGAAVEVLELRPLAGDASTRRYVRARLCGGGAPPSVVVMMLTDRGVAMSSEELADLPAGDELPFLNVHRFLEKIGVAVPALYAEAVDQGLLVLEDVGDAALRDVVEGASRAETERRFRDAIDCLLRIQLDGSRRPDPSCIAFQQRFDRRLYDWEFEHFIEHGIERRLGSMPAATAVRMRSSFGAISSRLAAEPFYLTHRDYHAWNLFVQADAIRVLDFQDALLAPAAYDLATLLGDRDTPRVLGPDLERQLVDYYRRTWESRGGPAWDPTDLEEVYALSALQKALKVVGRFHYLDRVKGKAGYLRYLPPTVERIAQLLPRVPDGEALVEVLGPYLPKLT